jgi:Arc/MetJ-type ribon-helix-helix transcriptional regulator
MGVWFRLTDEDLRVIDVSRRPGERASDVIRRALRLLDREAWEERARADMHRLVNEDVSIEADAWRYDSDGNIQIVGTDLTVRARPTDHP